MSPAATLADSVVDLPVDLFEITGGDKVVVESLTANAVAQEPYPPCYNCNACCNCFCATCYPAAHEEK